MGRPGMAKFSRVDNPATPVGCRFNVFSQPDASARDLLSRHRNTTSQSLTNVSGCDSGIVAT